MYWSFVIATLAAVCAIDQPMTNPTAQTQPDTSPSISTAEPQQIRAKALAGDADSQYKMGRLYEEGRGVSRSDEEAVKWYRKAAEQGHPAAQNDLGLMYLDGQGVDKSPEAAFT